MAKAKTNSKRTRGRPKGEREPLVAIINIKGSPAYQEWLDELHERSHIPRATLIRLGLKLWAEQNGYQGPPVDM